MIRGEPKHKGVGLVAVVKGVSASPKATALVPAPQRHYLTDPLLPSGWYPERDYNALLLALAEAMSGGSVGDVWAYFGRTAARRDVAGDQEGVPAQSRTENAGIYRNFRTGSAEDVAGLCLRMAKIWSMYHDTGRVTFTRHPDKQGTLLCRLHDFQFPVRGMAELQTAFSIEFAKLAGIAMRGRLERFAEGRSICEWHYEVAATPQNLASLANLAVDAA